jgi:hypothetical protein
MPLIAASYALEHPPLVVMQEAPFEAELEILDEVCHKLRIHQPEVVINGPFEYNTNDIVPMIKQIEQSPFLHPFIGSPEMQQEQSSLPDATSFNDKAQMRRLMKSNGLSENVIRGKEIFSDSDTKLDKIISAVDEAIRNWNNISDIRVKLGDSASGLCTVVVSPREYLESPEYQSRAQRAIENFFKNNGSTEPGNIVLEDNLEQREGWVDYGTRGYLLPDRNFIPTSFARQITDNRGGYMGAVVSTTFNIESIGLTRKQANNIRSLANQFSKSIHAMGYWGPVNLDVFGHPENESIALAHDWNLRDGGTSGSALALHLWDSLSTMDLDLKLTTERELSDIEINSLIARCWQEKRIILYSTTFLRYPKVDSSGVHYTVKTIAEPEVAIESDKILEIEIRKLISQMDTYGLGRFSFNRE